NKEPELQKKSQEEALSSVGNVFDWLKSFLLSLTAVIFIFTLIFRGVTVSGDSMLPTLEDREYLIISDLLYQPKTGDIVVVQSPNYKGGAEPLIKRVIATGGQTLKINFQTWEVWVDGVELQEDYIAFEEGLNMNPEDLKVNENNEAELVVEENCIFVMGDHRNDSLDSRSEAVGQIDQRYIMGRVLIRVTPFSKFGKVK
ncbi:MAG: signal peptidase I, partial [Clostridia bacterium]|nr:signal peptidase I [Clostridia bacterium]